MGHEHLPESESEQDNRLDPEAAQEKANMMRAALEVDPETGEMIDDGKNPAEWLAAEEVFGPRPNIKDYDDALRAVEELETLAAQQASMGKIMMVVRGITEKTNYTVAGFVKNLVGNIAPEGYESDGEEHKELVRKLADAAKRLAELKKAAEQYKDLGRGHGLDLNSDQEKRAA